jgi:glycosyltransferase 2 family protein
MTEPTPTPHQPPKRGWRSVRRWLPGVIISLVALVVVFQLSNWQDIGLAFSALRPGSLAIAILLTTISLGTRAMGWAVLLEHRPTLSKAFFTINLGYLLNNILPLRAGEFGRALYMGRSTGISPLHVLSTIVIERMFDLVMAAALLLTTLPLALGMVWARPVAIATLVIVISALVAMYLVARHNEKVLAWIHRLGEKWPIVERLIVPRIGSILSGLSVLRRPSQFFLSFFWIALSWALWVVVYWIMLLTIAPEAPLWWAVFVNAVLAMGIAIPSAPSALGVFEAAIVGALAILGVTEGALGYAILMHLFQFGLTGIFGFLALLQAGRSISTIFGEIQARE